MMKSLEVNDRGGGCDWWVGWMDGTYSCRVIYCTTMTRNSPQPSFCFPLIFWSVDGDGTRSTAKGILARTRTRTRGWELTVFSSVGSAAGRSQGLRNEYLSLKSASYVVCRSGLGDGSRRE